MGFLILETAPMLWRDVEEIILDICNDFHSLGHVVRAPEYVFHIQWT